MTDLDSIKVTRGLPDDLREGLQRARRDDLAYAAQMNIDAVDAHIAQLCEGLEHDD